ncbi:MAG: hypothetical protein CBD39_04030 [Flavobacteriaceae bacterium TMED179]|nr:MAG: hypothetical protein CBD39_04030 [Flavobacteriaceae bacterium TMED179]|tara:strand:- start:41296 stop:42267 length:972 start_codon:yes stop_codon:yes gene_type:complete
MRKSTIFLFLFSLFSCNSNIDKNQAFVPESSGNLNHVTIVMPEIDWKSSLGNTVRDSMGVIYKGLPLDEPQYSLRYMNPATFKGFARQNRNIIWFRKDSISRFQLAKNQFARPQILALITGQDQENQAFSFEENVSLLRRIIAENERKEKLRRINKSLSTENNLREKFGIRLEYPSAYKTVKDTTNFVWIQKSIQKGHLNLVVYTLPENSIDGAFNKKILNIRDSIGRLYIPGRLPGSYLITERAFRPYFFKVNLDGKKGYLTKGTWEVANDFMAGPFVNYMIHDSVQKRLVVIEGFAFAPSVSKRDYMFELNTILSTLKLGN